MNPTDAAFPVKYNEEVNGKLHEVNETGMDIRTYAAIQAMNGILAGVYSSHKAWSDITAEAKKQNISFDDLISKQSIESADELLSQLSKPKP